MQAWLLGVPGWSSRPLGGFSTAKLQGGDVILEPGSSCVRLLEVWLLDVGQAGKGFAEERAPFVQPARITRRSGMPKGCVGASRPIGRQALYTISELTSAR